MWVFCPPLLLPDLFSVDASAFTSQSLLYHVNFDANGNLISIARTKFQIDSSIVEVEAADSGTFQS